MMLHRFFRKIAAHRGSFIIAGRGTVGKRQQPSGTNKKSPPQGADLFVWRKRWDSNPRALADNRISSAARYDHFDTLPQPSFIIEKIAAFVKGRSVKISLHGRVSPQTARDNVLSFPCKKHRNMCPVLPTDIFRCLRFPSPAFISATHAGRTASGSGRSPACRGACTP